MEISQTKSGGDDSGRAGVRCQRAAHPRARAAHLQRAGAVETGQDIGDALFGFRVYPLAALLAVMAGEPAYAAL